MIVFLLYFFIKKIKKKKYNGEEGARASSIFDFRVIQLRQCSQSEIQNLNF